MWFDNRICQLQYEKEMVKRHQMRCRYLQEPEPVLRALRHEVERLQKEIEAERAKENQAG